MKTLNCAKSHNSATPRLSSNPNSETPVIGQHALMSKTPVCNTWNCATPQFRNRRLFQLPNCVTPPILNVPIAQQPQLCNTPSCAKPQLCNTQLCKTLPNSESPNCATTPIVQPPNGTTPLLSNCETPQLCNTPDSESPPNAQYTHFCLHHQLYNSPVVQDPNF